MTEGNTQFGSVIISLKLQCHDVFKTDSVKDWLLIPVERKVRQRDLGKVERGGERKKRTEGRRKREREQAVLAGP